MPPSELVSSRPPPVLGATTLLVAVDHRPTISLNGEWRVIVDPYGTGLYTFHGELRTDGYFMNGKQAPGGEPVEYIFKLTGAIGARGLEHPARCQRFSVFSIERA